MAAADVLDLLSGLVEKSLVLLETEALEARYRMLETIRQFARERLEEVGEAAEFGRRHAQFFLARAAAADPFLPVHAEGWQERLPGGVGDPPGAAGWFWPGPPAGGGKPRLSPPRRPVWVGRGACPVRGPRRETAAAGG